MKWWLCIRITAKLGNSKRQHCSWQEKKKRKKEKKKKIYIYIYKLGTIVRKSPRRKRGWKDRKGKEVFYSHMNRRNTSYVQGAKC